MLDWHLESDAQLVEMQADRIMYFKKRQLKEKIQERRTERLSQLRSTGPSQILLPEQPVTEVLHEVGAANYPSPTLRTPTTTPTGTINLVSPSPGSDATPRTPRTPTTSTPTKRKKTSHLANNKTQSQTSPPPMATHVQLVKDTPLLRLIVKMQREHHGEVGVYPPPLCNSHRCGYSRGCLHGQRYALAKRLVELEVVLFGLAPADYVDEESE